MINDSSEAALENGGVGPLKDTSDRGETDYLRITQDAYDTSMDYMTASLRSQWERNIANFMSRHPSGSKYHTDAYKHRSRLFRPKTRASIRQKEAALALAFFSTSDALSIAAEDQSSQMAAQVASVLQDLLTTRLKSSDMAWFQTVVAAFQDSCVTGTTITYQGWEHIEEETSKTEEVQQYNETTGEYEIVKTKIPEIRILKDGPVVDLVPIENFLIDPGAHWLDPVNTSPYTIELIPMYIVDIIDRMDRPSTNTTEPEWKQYPLGDIQAALNDGESSDSTRMAKEGTGRADPKNETGSVTEYTIVWVYRVIARLPGEGDMVWYTLGKNLMLSDPKPVTEVYPHLKPGERPYVAGRAVIEAHRNYPSSVVELGQDVQAAANDILNQRFDNVKQVLNKRYFVARQKEVDLKSLRRNVPGSITMMNDPERDVKTQETPDVTNSAYNEQNLFNADFDEITGSFSVGSVSTNRQLNETVGGMKMLKDPSNALTEYLIRTFAETWARPVLDQLARLVRRYESDETIMAVAGSMAQAEQEGQPQVVDIRNVAIKVDINVGFGVTDPEGRIRRLLMGVDSIGKVSPKAISRIRETEITKEVMGILGYQDGKRFFMDDQELAEYGQKNPPPPDPEQLKIESSEKIKEAEIMSKERVEAARIEQDRLIWAERIMSDERKKAAELNVQAGKDGAMKDLELGKRAIEIEKLDNDRLKLAINREDMLRKDAEIPDKEQATKNRSGGSIV